MLLFLLGSSSSASTCCWLPRAKPEEAGEEAGEEEEEAEEGVEEAEAEVSPLRRKVL